jgi:hypothetical protein
MRQALGHDVMGNNCRHITVGIGNLAQCHWRSRAPGVVKYRQILVTLRQRFRLVRLSRHSCFYDLNFKKQLDIVACLV